MPTAGSPDANATTVAQVRERVRAGGLLAGDARVVAMFSGGRDSVCLLDVAVALCGSARVRALHVNYGLRAEADEDERHCRELCGRLGVELEVVRAERAPDAAGNMHAWARELRYGVARELAERLDGPALSDVAVSDVGLVPGDVAVSDAGLVPGDVAVSDVGLVPGDVAASDAGLVPGDVAGPANRGAAGGALTPTVIATGHTASDQVETILYRLAASPGRRALLGMSAREGRLVRPLLGLTRNATGAYCLELKLAWREDVSNDSEQYARARVRHRLLKALDAVHPAAGANVLRTAELLREETELLDALVDAELAGGWSIAIERLRELHPALQRLVVIRLAEHAAGTFVPQAGERVAEILALGARGGRAELHVGGLAGAVIEGGRLQMAPIQPREQH